MALVNVLSTWVELTVATPLPVDARKGCLATFINQDCGRTRVFISGMVRSCCSRGLVDQMANTNSHNPKNLRVRTLAEPDRGCDAIGSHQQDPGKSIHCEQSN